VINGDLSIILIIIIIWLKLSNFEEVVVGDIEYDINNYKIISNDQPLSTRVGTQYASGYVYKESKVRKVKALESASEVAQDERIPESISTTITRKIRDTKIIKELKAKYNNRCQICGKTILRPNEEYYSEGHHLKPLGGGHKGSDTKDNVIILCPYHHAEFDYGSISIDPDSLLINHINKEDEFSGKKLKYERTDINKTYLKYHQDHLFNR
jgi:predicted restriction endonuclease